MTAVPAGLAIHRTPARDPAAARVVFVHGSMDRGAAFLKAIRRLPELDCVRYDRRGYGRSRGMAIATDFATQVADLLAVVGDDDGAVDGEAAVRDATLPTVLVGHSLGGVIALAAAQEVPARVQAVGAFEAPMGWEPWWPGSSAGNDALSVLGAQGAEDAAERFMRRIVGDERWESLPAATRAARRAEGPALVAEIASLRGRAPYDAARIRCPVVAGRGSETAPHHLRASAELAMRAPDGELVEIAGAGHGAPNSHPAEFASFVRRVVERAGGGAKMPV